MKQKVLGALTGVLVAAGLLIAVPSAAHAATWSNYIDANARPGIKSSGVGKVYGNRGRITAPGNGVGYSAKFTVIVNAPKGKIIQAGATEATGRWYDQTVRSPQTNTKARCEMYGAVVSLQGSYLCDVYK